MSQSKVLTRQEHPEAIVIRVLVPILMEGNGSIAVRDALYQESEFGDRPLILDLAAVEYLCSAVLGWLITARMKLRQRGQSFQPPCQRRGIFAFFPDQAAALQALRQGETDPLLLCGVRADLQDLFRVC